MNPFKILLAIIMKNFKLVFRSKTTALIILIGPILIIAIVGTAFNSSGLNDIRVGVYNPKPTSQTGEMMRAISSSSFIIQRFEDKEKCIDGVRQTDLHVCMAFPENFNLENMTQQNQIEFFVDFSKINLVWMIWDVMQSQIRGKSQQLSRAFTETMLDKLKETASAIDSNKGALVQISTNGKNMSMKLDSMKDQIISLDVSVSFSDMNVSDLSKQSADSQVQIDAFKAKIDALSLQIEGTRQGLLVQSNASLVTLETFEQDLIEQKNLITSKKAQGEVIYAAMCTLDPSKQECIIFKQQLDYVDDQVEMIDSYLGDIKDAKGQIKTQQQMLGQGVDLSSIKSDLDMFSLKMKSLKAQLDQVSSGMDEAKKKSDEVSEVKDTTAQQIDEMNNLLKSNLADIDKMTALLDTTSKSLNASTDVSSDTIVKPITSSLRSVGKQSKFINYFLPSLLILVVMFIGILLSSTAIMGEKESKAFFRNFLAPVNDLIFVLGHFFSTAIILMAQSVVLLLIAHYAFSLSITRFGSLVLAFFLINTVFILFGMFIGYFFRSEEGSTIASISSSCLFLLFSSLAVPIESMSEGIGKLAMYNPFVLGETILKKILLFDKGIGDSMAQITIMLIYIFVLFIIVVFLHHWSKNKQ